MDHGIIGDISRCIPLIFFVGMLTLLNSFDATKDLNIGLKSAAASSAAAGFRIIIMPIDTVKVRGILISSPVDVFVFGPSSSLKIPDNRISHSFMYGMVRMTNTITTHMIVDNNASDWKILSRCG